MVVNAEDLTVQTINPAYKQLLGGRDVTGLPLSEVFSGQDLDQLLKLAKQAVREIQAIHTPAINATVAGADENHSRLIHTIVPIPDESGGNVRRLFIFSEHPSGGGLTSPFMMLKHSHTIFSNSSRLAI